MGKWIRHAVQKYFPDFGNAAGVYAIFYNGECVYIGSTVNLNERIRSHFQIRKKKFYSNKFYFVKTGVIMDIFMVAIRKNTRSWEHLMVEMKLIERLKPRWNGKRKDIRGLGQYKLAQ